MPTEAMNENLQPLLFDLAGGGSGSARLATDNFVKRELKPILEKLGLKGGQTGSQPSSNGSLEKSR
jgi:hypothetical protein